MDISEKIRELLLEDEGRAVYAYYTAEWGDQLGIYLGEDGSLDWAITEKSSVEIDPKERPIVALECPGIETLDAQPWTEGWTEYDPDAGEYIVDDTGERIDFGECIRRCCRDGYIDPIVDELVERAIDQLKDLIWENPHRDPEKRWEWYEEHLPCWDFERPSEEEFAKMRQNPVDACEWIDSHLEELL